MSGNGQNARKARGCDKMATSIKRAKLSDDPEGSSSGGNDETDSGSESSVDLNMVND